MSIFTAMVGNFTLLDSVFGTNSHVTIGIGHTTHYDHHMPLAIFIYMALSVSTRLPHRYACQRGLPNDDWPSFAATLDLWN